jgi:hypothetical protein
MNKLFSEDLNIDWLFAFYQCLQNFPNKTLFFQFLNKIKMAAILWMLESKQEL